jgi:hypothetical protein
MPAFWIAAAVRLLSGLVLVLVATYYLLASIPFAYYHFLQFPHFWWMPLFIRIHPLLMLIGTAGIIVTMRDLPPRWTPWTRYLGIAGATIGIAMIASSLVPSLQSYETAGALYIAPMLLMSAAGAVDLIARCSNRVGTSLPPGGQSGLVAAAALAGGLTATLYLVVSTLGGQSLNGLLSSEILIVGGASLLGHAGLFVLTMAALVAMVRIARRARWSALIESLAVGGIIAAFIAIAVRRSLLVTLPLNEPRALTISALMGAGLVLHWQALLMRRTSSSSGREDAIRATLLPAASSARGRAVAAALCLIVMVASIALVPNMVKLADWGAALQKLMVFAAWLGSLGLMLSLPQRRALQTRLATGIVFTAVVILSVAASTARTNKPLTATHELFDVETALDRYATLDSSVMALLDLTRPMTVGSGFFNTLFSEALRTDSARVQARPLRLMDNVHSSETYRPHIFIIVVDSLRRDYLSAYNPEATFTPHIGDFGRESLVMRNAFATYAGTALSQPSIWAGGLIQRYMYVKPFGVVNNLERLLAAGGYRKYISMDAILNTLLEDRTNLTPLDAAIAHPEREEDAFKFELCTTLQELSADLDRDANNPAPVFFYSQPQSLHVRIIASHGPRFIGTRIGTREFFAPAVTALQRLDACMGGFIDYLKAKRMYDDSIIVLTSDHGDLYGEDNLFGHEFHLRPEIMRVPLIMHVPERLLARRRSDPDAVTFLTDITPTLYSLLGYGPLLRHPLLGQSFVTTEDAPLARPDLYLVQSSYNRLFGLLFNHGTRLYSANANTLTEALYDIEDGRVTHRQISGVDRVVYRRLLFEQLGVFNDYYAPRQERTH